MDWGKEENCFVVKLMEIWNSFPRTKEESDHLACCQLSVRKPAFLMLWKCISAYRTWNFHIWKGTINAERYIQVLEQHLPPSRWCLFQEGPCIFQQDNTKPYIQPLLRQCSFVVEDSRCWTDLPAVQTFHQLKTFTTKYKSKRPRLLSI